MAKHYTVLSHTIIGRNGRVYRKGKLISENDLVPANIQGMIKSKRIEEYCQKSPRITGKLKVAIVSAVWKRPEVFEMFAKGINNLVKCCPDVEFHVIIAGSEWRASEYMVKNQGYTYIEIPNEPLATKHNSTTYAAGKLGVDYVICLGSDDIISPELFREYEKHMREGVDFIGVTDFYFYDTVTKKAAYWGGYREKWRLNHTCGAGRVLSARLMTAWDWMPWENKDSNILDNSMESKLAAMNHSKEIFSLKENGLYALDVKSSTNMTPFKLWDNTEFIDTKIIHEQFKYIF